MGEINSLRKEVLLAELDLHKTEFSALRDEIIHSIDAERQALNLSLVAAGAGLSLLSFIDRQTLYSVILLFPFVFHVILWEMLNSIKSLSHISSYLTTSLIPRVNQILDELGSERKDILALGWEIRNAKTSLKPSQLILTSLTPTRHWMPILAVAALLIAYSVIIRSDQHIPSSTEMFLVFLNLVFLIWAAIQNVLTVRSYMQKVQPAGKEDHPGKMGRDLKPRRQPPSVKSKNK